MNERHGYSAGSNSTSPLSSIQDLSLSLGSSSSSPELKKPAFNVQGRPLTGRHHFAPFRRHLFPPQSDHGLAPMPWQPMLEQRSQPNQSFQQSQSIHNFGSRSRPQPQNRSNFVVRPGRECKFCKNNGESREQYTSHVLRNPVTGKLICPVLRSHVCEICGVSGDDAHTRNYCPQGKQEKKMLLAVPVCLKKTRHQSDGQVRR